MMRWLILGGICVVVFGVLGIVTWGEYMLRRRSHNPYQPRYRDGGEE